MTSCADKLATSQASLPTTTGRSTASSRRETRSTSLTATATASPIPTSREICTVVSASTEVRHEGEACVALIAKHQLFDQSPCTPAVQAVHLHLARHGLLDALHVPLICIHITANMYCSSNMLDEAESKFRLRLF